MLDIAHDSGTPLLKCPADFSAAEAGLRLVLQHCRLVSQPCSPMVDDAQHCIPPVQRSPRGIQGCKLNE